MKLLAITLGAMLLFSCNYSRTDREQERADTLANSAWDNEHNSRNSLDWHGTYKGEIPSGVEMEVTIHSDNSFAVKSNDKNANKVTEDQGSVNWEQDNNYIRLKGEEVDYQFKVEENRLVYIEDLQNIPSDTTTLASYVLEKEERFPMN